MNPSTIFPDSHYAAPKPWVEIKSKTVRKRGAKYSIQREVEAMRYVQQHTTIPVPYVIEVHQTEEEDEEEDWFLMEKLGGVQLDMAWSNLDSAAQARTISQLKSYLAELHALRPPTSPGWMGSCSRGPAYDHRMDSMKNCGPFESVNEFHDMFMAPAGPVFPHLIPRSRHQLPDDDDDDIVFVHGDISWENILVDAATGHVTGIIDWEMAGFWPRWWEYRKGLCGGMSRIWWAQILKQIMVANEDATEADMDLELF
jgi:aminoglycoside phosphotransferase (APT) family kinase protein